MTASELASIFQLEGPPPSFAARTRRRLWKVSRALAVLGLLIGAGGVAVHYLKPEWIIVARDASTPYVGEAKAQWTNLLASVGLTKASTTDSAVTSADGSALPPTTPIQLQAQAKPLIPATAPATDALSAHGPTVVTLPTNAPIQPDAPRITLTPRTVPEPAAVPESGTSIVDLSTPTEIDALAGQASIFTPTTRPMRLIPAVIEPTATPTAPAAARDPERPSASGSTSSMSIDDATRQAGELRKSALDAEARRDWKAALIIWEQISVLPEEARPSDLKVRLQNARERLAE